MNKALSFQELIISLQSYWAKNGCALIQPIDMPVGAGTFHPSTFLRAIGPEPWNVAYTQACRRPADGRYGKNPNRLQHYYQFQVLLKPSPDNIQQLYLSSLEFIGLDLRAHDVRFVEDNWESPTLGAWGLGWEVWLDGMEITQFTYFQQVGGMSCMPVSGEITYGLERLAMYLQEKEDVYDLLWSKHSGVELSYREQFLQNEREMSCYNFEMADIAELQTRFIACEKSCAKLCAEQLPLAAYEQVLTASHAFNLLDARKAVSVNQRQDYILKVRHIAAQVAKCWYQSREQAGFPLCHP